MFLKQIPQETQCIVSVLANFETKKKKKLSQILINLALLSIRIIPNGNLLAVIPFKERQFLVLSQL